MKTVKSMRGSASFWATIAVTATLLTACANEGQKEAKTQEGAAKADTQAATLSVKVDTAASVIKWIGRKGIAGVKVGQHNGTVRLSGGSLKLNGNKVVGGEFTIDMQTITDLDLKGPEKAKLENHLRDTDFFLAKQYPTAKFEITSITEAPSDSATHIVKGNLTIRDKTNNIEFPARINVSPTGTVSANAKFAIDRTRWGIVYGNDKNLGDKFIHPNIDLEINLEAKN
ncbi:MAG: YceI family protein [Bacteroidia bacterium]|nr:YceI family protein [Bacteroidia bacterium]MDW8332698.1 YceI family protein [Bacteroidia bacterium]